MATSGTFTFNPSLGELVLLAYARCGVRRTEMVAEHMVNARMEVNLLLSDWSNQLVNAWAVELEEQALTLDVATYAVDGSTVSILDAYISTGTSQNVLDRMIMPISRSEYAAMPTKEQTGEPTVFWYDRLVSPTITVWPTPDASSTYTLKYYRVRQIQDANYVNAQTIEVPYRFLDALSWELAARLAVIYAADRAEGLSAKAAMQWQRAAKTDGEQVPFAIIPGLSGYYR